MTHLTLLPVLDRDGVRVTAGELRALSDAGTSFALDGSRVERVGLAGLQLLISVLRAGAPGDPEVQLVKASTALRDAARLAGVSALLGIEAEVAHGA